MKPTLEDIPALQGDTPDVIAHALDDSRIKAAAYRLGTPPELQRILRRCYGPMLELARYIGDINNPEGEKKEIDINPLRATKGAFTRLFHYYRRQWSLG